MDFIEIGEIAGAHGVKGYVKVNPFTDFPERFKKMKSAVIEKNNGTFGNYAIEDVIFHKNMVLIKFGNINNMDEAGELKGCKIVTEKKDLIKLPEDSYYIFDLIGCDVFEESEYLGKVTDIIETGSNDVYVVKKGGDGGNGELLIPALAWVVINVDVESKKIQVKLPKGLREL